ncbi:unnamed protein product [Moneuplotes crassus]|uniref:Uncharacterized protein n=1 Tax=Euplotes crassus TaxID=5936 RepID=A0AAD1Y5Z4_EUPCR|nr:unnamed protein product [Moneuplotes crassus]
MGCCNSVPKELLCSDTPFFQIRINSKIWNKESHGLFDYENQSFQEVTIQQSGNFFIYGADSKVFPMIPSSDMDDSESSRLLSVAYKKGRYWIYHYKDFSTCESLKKPSDQPWISLKHLNPISHSARYDANYGYKLKQGDIIKFGRVRFRISRISSDSTPSHEYRGIQTENNHQIVESNESNIIDDSMYFEKQLKLEELNNINLSGVEIDSGGYNDLRNDNKSESKQSKDACRICLSCEEDPDDPLVTICKCSGTMGLIHLECIKGWLDSKLHKKFVPHTFSYNWKNLRCELCKERLKDLYYIHGKPVHLLNYKRPQEGTYITLESFTNTPHKTIHVINLQENLDDYNEEMEFTIGRDNNVCIRITDISVSRNHAVLTCKNGEFFVKDTDSKFGTLVLLQSPFPIEYHDKWDLSVQIGKNLITISPEMLEKNICGRNKFEKIYSSKVKTYNEYSFLYPKVMNKKFGIPVPEEKPEEKSVSKPQKDIIPEISSHRMKSRNNLLINNLTPENDTEEEKLRENILGRGTNMQRNRPSKDSTIIPTARAGDTEIRMSVDREQPAPDSQRNNVRTTSRLETPTISSNRKNMDNNIREESTRSRHETLECVNSTKMNKIVLKNGWCESQKEESKYPRRFHRAQSTSVEHIYKGSMNSRLSLENKFFLPKIPESSSKLRYEDSEECDEEHQQKSNEDKKEKNNEEDKEQNHEFAQKLNLSEIPLEESKERIITRENLEDIVSLSPKESLMNEILPPTGSGLRRSKTRNCLHRGITLKKRLIFTSKKEKDECNGNERLNSEANLLTERKLAEDEDKVSKNSEDLEFKNEDNEQLLK